MFLYGNCVFSVCIINDPWHLNNCARLLLSLGPPFTCLKDVTLYWICELDATLNTVRCLTSSHGTVTLCRMTRPITSKHTPPPAGLHSSNPSTSLLHAGLLWENVSHLLYSALTLSDTSQTHFLGTREQMRHIWIFTHLRPLYLLYFTVEIHHGFILTVMFGDQRLLQVDFTKC